MAVTNFSPLLGLALPTTGDLSGTWGTTVNDSITGLIDSAVAGTTNISTDANVTLTTTNGAANQARNMVLLFSGARTAIRTVTAPAQSKVYTVINATTGGFAVTLVGAGPTTGLTIPNGASAVVAWNGSDFVEVGAGSIGNLVVNGTLTVTGATTLQSTLAVTGVSTLTAGAVVQGLTVGRGAGAVATNTAVGASALAANTSGSLIVAVGTNALAANTSGAGGTALGREALKSNTTGDWNVGIGVNALTANTTGSSNIAIGQNALQANTTASNNVAVGFQAGYSNATGTNLTALGYQALYTTTASSSTAVGYLSGQLTTTGVVTAVGNQALKANTNGSNDAFGSGTLIANTTGTLNAAFGNDALKSNTTGGSNVAVGKDALQANTTANNNTAVGYQALNTTTTSSQLVALGYQTGYANTSGQQNTYLGYEAGKAVTTGWGNLLVGNGTGNALTTGSGNTFIGGSDGRSHNPCGSAMTTGSGNVIIGNFSGNAGGLDIRTASNFIVLSDGANNPRGIFDNNGYFLLGKTSATTSSKLEVDASSNVAQFWHTGSSDTIGIYMRHGRGLSGFSGKMISFRRNDDTEVGSIVIGDSSTSYNTSSDYRLKNTIAPMTGALAKVALLKPCTYKWNSSGSNGHGFIAHELAEVVPECVTGEKDAVDDEGNPKYQGIDTSFLVATLTAAIQEQQAIIESLKARLDAANL